ncbi:aliphatic sulfonate ABC transporter substrate-binding protein [Ureibacillus sp. FSL K6-8385]|uniref:aliphatic sulfonate ABC transporter substrate-binding protein n=1 Tax=Ureibacillus TaxID=160795 RepID=UPI002E1B7915|nr:aliphatic sulfonate ABC transporter substrate-binding protein [Ureibacillus terrenus]MED3763836.1 aliphatic sulfonate ABC transporter substrate-binding protein [Ureibacillus terrenus]
MKKRFLFMLALFALLLAACSSDSESENKNSSSSTKTINLGIQQVLSPLWIAKEKGWLEEAFEEVGVKINWTEFQSGPPQFEGIAAGKLDITEVGNTPPLSGQAAGIDFKEIALLSKGKTNNAILIPEDSDIKSVKDLVGKKVAVAKGSSAYGLLYEAFDKEGVDPSKVEIIQLQPDEAQPAFENGTVDAWATWEPFISYQTVGNHAKALIKCEDIGVFSPLFTIARTDFIEENPELVSIYLKVYKKATDWLNEHPEEAVQFFADLKGLDPVVVEEVLKNTPYEMQVIEEDVIESQQRVADLFVEQGVFGNKIDVETVVENRFIEKLLKGGE